MLISQSINNTFMISGLTAMIGMQGLAATQVTSCADWNPCCFEYGLNPPPTCPTCCGCTWYGEIDFLYWKPFIENASPCSLLTADQALVSVAPSESATAHTVAKNKDFRFDWDSGFKVAVGYGFPCDKWGLALTWTHYRTDANFAESGFTDFEVGTPGILTDLKVPLPGFINSDQTALLIGFGTSTLDARWDFQFNQVDLDFFRDFYVGCSLSLKPFVGLRALFLKNRIDIFSQYGDVNPDFTIFPYSQATLSQHLRSDFKSFGLKGGLESFWEVTCGLGVYGSVGASLVYASYDIHHRAQALQTLSGSGVRIGNDFESPYSYNGLKMLFDLAIGIEWRQPVNCNQNLFVVKAGWEHHLLFQASQFSTLEGNSINTVSFAINAPTTSINAGNISLYGFVFSVGFSF